MYIQISTHKNFILFGFKVLTITDLYYNKFSNFPFSLRPVALIALKEDYGHVKFIMKTLINPETERIMENGCTLCGGYVSVEIIRSLFTLRWLVSWMAQEALQVIFVQRLTPKLRVLNGLNLASPINRFITDRRQSLMK